MQRAYPAHFHIGFCLAKARAMSRLMYKIFRPDEWAALQADGSTLGAPVDLADGYIHFSTAEHLSGTLDKWFAGAGPLVIAELNADDFGDDLRWEAARGGALFPHLYAPLALARVGQSWDITPNADNRYTLPELTQ